MALLSLLGCAALILCFLVSAYVPHQALASSSSSSGGKDIAVGPSMEGLCASSIIVHGYKCQEHEVTTKDGYILSLQRIPEGRAEVSGVGIKKQPVITQHGLLVDGMIWLANSPEQNLPMILADSGFDVWIVNSRGTRYSRRHTSLDPSSEAYWNWSWDELAEYDLPAVFDFVYSQTGQKINYVGHSLWYLGTIRLTLEDHVWRGTLMALASFSEGKLVNQVKSAALLSPVAYLSHMKSALAVVVAKSFVGETLTVFGIPEFNPRGLPGMAFVNSVCAFPGVDCSDLLTALTGKNCCLNSSSVQLLLNHDQPQPTSTKNMVHLSQLVRSGVLSKFNYLRPSYNLKHYGKVFPAIYNLSNIPHDLPLFLSYGGQDALADVTDVANLIDVLKFHDVDKLSVQFIKEYAHLDHVMAVNAEDIVFNAIVAFFKRQF